MLRDEVASRENKIFRAPLDMSFSELSGSSHTAARGPQVIHQDLKFRDLLKTWY